MRLLNVSVGRIQPIQIGSAVIKTAHIKEPVPEPWRITESGVEGDQRAVHPDKLYAFSRSAYEYWGERLGVDPDAWPDGFFGENLTLDVLDEKDMRVGDILTVGSKVKLVVSGARTPCVKLAWRLNQPRSFQKEFARSRHAGVYLDILEPGVVRPDDRLERITHDPAMPSVADVCDFIDSHHPPPLDALNRLLSCEYLSPANRLLLGAKKEIAERAADAAENRWRGWRAFNISSIKDEAKDIKSFELTPADGEPLCRARPGQFVGVRLSDERGDQIDRTWSLSAYPEGADCYKITVLRQRGPGSQLIHRLREGDQLALRAPTGNFTLDMGSIRPPVFVAAGVGVTPIMAMIEAHYSKENPGDAHLIYAAKTPAHMALRGRIEALRKSHPGFHVSYIFSRAKETGCLYGRITRDIVEAALKDLHVTVGGKRIDLPWFEADFYICGPDRFCEELSASFTEGGANPSHIYTERFNAPPPSKSAVEEARIVFAKSQKETVWTKSDNLSLLELAEELGVNIEHDCRAGACLTCKTRLLNGATTADVDADAALLCIGRPQTRFIEIDA